MSCMTSRSAIGHLLAIIFLSSSLWSVSGLENRILGGEEISIADFPFQLALEGGGRHFCGGSILASRWALTAAHCVYDQPARWMAFRAGSPTREKGGTLHPVKVYHYHEKYTQQGVDYDVAVVLVTIPFNFKLNLQCVTLPTVAPVGGIPVSVAGWGFLEQEQLRKPKHLLAINIQTTGWNECKKLYPGLTPRMMCAGAQNKDICTGDSGGPLILGEKTQVGIVSWSYKCGDGLPSVYTNISVVEGWIRKKTRLDGSIVFPDN